MPRKSGSLFRRSTNTLSEKLQSLLLLDLLGNENKEDKEIAELCPELYGHSSRSNRRKAVIRRLRILRELNKSEDPVKKASFW